MLGDGVLEALALLVGTLARRQTSRADAGALRAVAHGALSRAVPAVCRSAGPAAAVAPGLSRPLQPRHHRRPRCCAGSAIAGSWQAVQAISRLAHAGCSAGELRVTAFNGRLFSPAQADAFDRTPIADTVMGRRAWWPSARTPVKRTTAAARASSTAISTSSSSAPSTSACSTTSLRPAAPQRSLRERATSESRSGTFYTPRALTASSSATRWSRSSKGRSADEILRLRVLDPAMGSGAFLVAACRYLAPSPRRR